MFSSDFVDISMPIVVLFGIRQFSFSPSTIKL